MDGIRSRVTDTLQDGPQLMPTINNISSSAFGEHKNMTHDIASLHRHNSTHKILGLQNSKFLKGAGEQVT